MVKYYDALLSELVVSEDVFMKLPTQKQKNEYYDWGPTGYDTM
jgi:hypothetical protein